MQDYIELLQSFGFQLQQVEGNVASLVHSAGTNQEIRARVLSGRSFRKSKTAPDLTLPLGIAAVYRHLNEVRPALRLAERGVGHLFLCENDAPEAAESSYTEVRFTFEEKALPLPEGSCYRVRMRFTTSEPQYLVTPSEWTSVASIAHEFQQLEPAKAAAVLFAYFFSSQVCQVVQFDPGDQLDGTVVFTTEH
ncbi:MAG: hypothetical protein K2W82_17790 [Candidatus Obscuribacterales bacterium]|nr:hypothetical protein [Candidatus Obscuribacterales bacterium]